jgi:hypothetical protein
MSNIAIKNEILFLRRIRIENEQYRKSKELSKMSHKKFNSQLPELVEFVKTSIKCLPDLTVNMCGLFRFKANQIC